MSNYNFQDLDNVMRQWAASGGGVVIKDPVPTNTVSIQTNGTEMIRVAEDGFYVRGVKVKADEKEAETVYKAFKEFLVWSELQKK